jgi:hypothetical protein
MATNEDLKTWVLDALNDLGPASVPQIAKHVWEHHEKELKASGDLFYTWQYAMRWAGQVLQKEGRLQKKFQGRKWRLV